MAHVIGFYLQNLIFSYVEANCNFFQVGMDAQTTDDKIKFMSVWMRFLTEGLPCTITVGVRRVKEGTGEEAYDILKRVITRSDLSDDNYLNTYSGKKYTYTHMENGEEKEITIMTSDIVQKMKKYYNLGMNWDKFLEGCVAFTRDGGPEVSGKFRGVAGRLKTDIAQKKMEH